MVLVVFWISTFVMTQLWGGPWNLEQTKNGNNEVHQLSNTTGRSADQSVVRIQMDCTSTTEQKHGSCRKMVALGLDTNNEHNTSKKEIPGWTLVSRS
jgi:hypothetical protein